MFAVYVVAAAAAMSYQSTWSIRSSRAVVSVRPPRMAATGVTIAVTGINSRRISSSIVIERGVPEVWAVLRDYDQLASFVPNLVVSQKVPSPEGVIRVFQEGAQNIIGFDFRASLVMNMVEQSRDALRRPTPIRRLLFTCHRSDMFQVQPAR